MRLECPTCQARYEVADSAIPPTGRSVQCGACGTTWFQEFIELAAAEDEILGASEETLPPEPEAPPEPPPANLTTEEDWARDIVEHSTAAPAPAATLASDPGLPAQTGEEFVDFSSGIDGDVGEDPPTYRTLYRKTPDVQSAEIVADDPIEAVRRSLEADHPGGAPLPPPPPIEPMAATAPALQPVAPAPEAAAPPAPTPPEPAPLEPAPPELAPAPEPAGGTAAASAPAVTPDSDPGISGDVTELPPRQAVPEPRAVAAQEPQTVRVEPVFSGGPPFDVARQHSDEVASILAWNRSGRSADVAAAEAEAHARALEANPAVPGFGPQDEPALPPNRGFATGLALSLLLFLVLLASYGLNREIAEAFPGTEPYLTRYVAFVDELRGAINGLWQRVLAAARETL